MMSLWRSAAMEVLKPVQVAQNRVLKLILNLPRLIPTIELYLLYEKTVLPILKASMTYKY